MYGEESFGQVALAEQVVLEPIVPLPPGLDVMQTDVIVVAVEIDVIHPVFE